MASPKKKVPAKLVFENALVRRIRLLEARNTQTQEAMERLSRSMGMDLLKINDRILEVKQLAVLGVGGILGIKNLTQEQIRILSPSQYRTLRDMDTQDMENEEIL